VDAQGALVPDPVQQGRSSEPARLASSA